MYRAVGFEVNKKIKTAMEKHMVQHSLMFSGHMVIYMQYWKCNNVHERRIRIENKKNSFYVIYQWNMAFIHVCKFGHTYLARVIYKYINH